MLNSLSISRINIKKVPEVISLWKLSVYSFLQYHAVSLLAQFPMQRPFLRRGRKSIGDQRAKSSHSRSQAGWVSSRSKIYFFSCVKFSGKRRAAGKIACNCICKLSALFLVLFMRRPPGGSISLCKADFRFIACCIGSW